MDVKAEVKSLTALNLEQLQQNNCIDVEPKKLNKMVELYNKAVDSIQSKGDDIAAIELKKALSIYPDFLEAKLLLSLCYIAGKQMDEAKKLLFDVTQQDKLMQRAYRYLKHVQDADKTRREIKKPRLFVDKANFPTKINKDIIKVVCGSLVGGVVAYIFLVSSMTDIKEKHEADTAVWQEQTYEYNVTIGNYKDQLSNVTGELQKREQRIQEKQEQIAYLKNVQKIVQIEKKLLEGNRIEAADMLLALKSVVFEDIEQYIFNHLYNTTMEPLAEELYHEGYRLYRQGNDEQTVEILRQSIRYSPEGYFVPLSLYFIGRGHERQGDIKNARHYFERLIEDFPGHSYVQHAQSRLNIIGQ